jgi:hypothetical protein
MTALVALCIAAGSVGCGGGNAGSGGGTSTLGAGGSGASGGGTTTTMPGTTGTTSSTTTTLATTGSGGSGGGVMDGCNPPAAADSLFALSDIDLDENTISMCKYRGDVLLIVNVAEA